MPPIMAITLYQPWASLVALGEKTYETRSWATSYRGPLVIHAGRSTDFIEYFYDDPIHAVLTKWHIARASDLPLGAGLCICQLVDCIPTEKLVTAISDQELHVGNYQPRRFGWKLVDIKPFDKPILARGMQKLWEWTP